MPSRRTSWLASPASSRSFSSCQIGLTMFATGRSSFGKATAGVPGSARKSSQARRHQEGCERFGVNHDRPDGQVLPGGGRFVRRPGRRSAVSLYESVPRQVSRNGPIPIVAVCGFPRHASSDRWRRTQPLHQIAGHLRLIDGRLLDRAHGERLRSTRQVADQRGWANAGQS
jgi:hypothetical protein